MSQFGQKVVAVIDTQSAFGVTVKALKQNVDTLTGQMSTLLADAPETLDTLNEIASAIADDPTFFTTMATANTTLQANITALSTAAEAARTALQTALQASIDSTALTGTNARGVLSGRLDSLELDPVTKTYVDAAVNNLIDAAPGVLNTLNELAAAIGDDANFITTVTNNIATVQADVNANELASNNAEAALSTRLDTLEADPTTATAVAAVQSDVDANETASDAAEAALSGRIDVLEADPTTATALAAVQTDVDANETASDAAEAALSTRLDTLEADPTTATAVAAVQTDVDANQVTAANAVTAQNTAMLAAVAVVQADVDQNEADCDSAINTEKARIDAILSGSAADKDTFAEIVTLINSVDTTNDNAFAGYVTSNNAAVAALQLDVNNNESDADTAIAAVQTDVDANEVTAANAVTAQNTAMLAAVAVVQADVDQNEDDADAAIAGILDGATFTGDIIVDEGSGSTIKLETTDATSAGIHIEGPSGSMGYIDTTNGFGNDSFQIYSANTWVRAINSGTGNLIVDGTLTLAGTAVTASATELNYVDGVTSSIQTQLNAIQADVNTNESDADTAIALKANKAGDTFTGDVVLRKSDGSAVSLVLSRADHADMSCEWKISPSYVSSSKECLTILAAGQPVAFFDERQRVSINKSDPDYTLDVGGDGKFSTGLTVGGLTDAANDSAAATAGVAVNQLYRNGSIVMIRVS